MISVEAREAQRRERERLDRIEKNKKVDILIEFNKENIYFKLQFENNLQKIFTY